MQQTPVQPLSPASSGARQPSPEAALTLLGPSKVMAQLWSQVRRLAPHVRSVLLAGRPDCGQAAVARLFLDLSPQSHRPFFQMSVEEIEERHQRPHGLASLPLDLVLYLPEIDQLSSGAQHGLLRLMRLRRARAFTVIASSGGDLRMLASTGHFLPELADALFAVRLAVPGLDQRTEDIPLLVQQMLTLKSGECGRALLEAGPSFVRGCIEYAWPGNLREMSEALGWLCAHSPGGELHLEDLRLALAANKGRRDPAPSAIRMVSLDTVVQEHLSAVLTACCGNKLRAAEVLGISRSTLYRMLDAAPVVVKPLPQVAGGAVAVGC